MLAVTGDEVQGWLAAALVLFFIVADFTILLLWLLGRNLRAPILAPRWSVSDLILGLQAVFLFIILAGTPPMLLAMRLSPGARGHMEAMPLPIKYGVVILPLSLLQQVALVCVPLLAASLKYGLPDGEAWDALGFRAGTHGWRRGLLVGLLAAAVVIPLSYGMEAAVEYALAHHLVPAGQILREMARNADAGTYVKEIGRSPLAVALAVLVIGILAPIGEEVFFRGFAYRILRQRCGVAGGIILSGILFGAIHGNPLALIPISLMGIALAVLRERTGSLIAPLTVHCVNNCLATVLLIFSR